MSNVMCLCGKPFGMDCRMAALMPNSYVLDTTLLTNDATKNRELLKNPNNFYKERIRHGIDKTYELTTDLTGSLLIDKTETKERVKKIIIDE